MELYANWSILPQWSVFGNLTLSTNKIKDFTAFVTTYDNMNDWNPTGQLEEHYENTTMLLSPSVISSVGTSVRPFYGYSPLEDLEFSLNGKFVGERYWDNTACSDRSLPAYFVANASVSQTFKFKTGNNVKLGLYVDNLFNADYCADVWVARYYFEAEKTYSQDEGLFPQAPISCMLRLVYSF